MIVIDTNVVVSDLVDVSDLLPMRHVLDGLSIGTPSHIVSN